MTEISDKIKQAVVVTGIVGGSIGVLVSSQSPNIETSTVNRSEIVSQIETSEINRAELVNIETSDVDRAAIAENENVPEAEMEMETIQLTKQDIEEIKTKPIIIKDESKPKVKFTQKVKTFFKPKEFHDTEDPEPYNVYMKNNWDGNFIRSEGVNARFGKYRKPKK